MTVNYNYFFSRIQKEEITIDELYTAITRLEIINITLNQDDNPQLIFESLNSTGVALSEGDKIRNFILMGLPAKLQNVYYEDYWNNIERCTSYDVSSFVRDYLSVKQQAIPSMSRVYITFKSYVDDEKIETKPLLEDLLAYAKRYRILLKGEKDSSPKTKEEKQLKACIQRLNRLETTVTRPFFLEVLRLYDEGKLSIQDVRDIFLHTENYLFRRTICDLPTNTLNKIFLMLHREIVRYDGTTDNYIEKFKFALLSKAERGRFPDDTEFLDAFSNRQVYLMNSKNKLYILERFENYGTLEDKDIYRHCDEGDYSIEHIMPQHLTPSWAKALGNDYEQIHELWLHRIANLTLTGYNSKYSNSDFLDKRDMKNGFRESGLRLNTWIGEQNEWTLNELEERNAILMNRALEIWAFPTTSYKPAEKQLDSYTLDDDVNLGGRSIIRFGFKNTEQPVDSWITMMEMVLKILHAEDKSILTKLAYTTESGSDLGQYVSSDPKKLRGPMEIDQGIYVERNTSTNTKISMLRKFFKAYEQNPEDLVFYLRDEGEKKAEEEAGTRAAQRRRYWEFTLPQIKEAHGSDGSFKNVNPSSDYWINGWFGISGFKLSCCINSKRVSAGIDLAKGEREKNKAAFDYLFARKDEIEKQIGASLEWMRFEGKASYISYVLGYGIDDEMSWPKLAKFQAEWSKKFYDVFVPLLREWDKK